MVSTEVVIELPCEGTQHVMSGSDGVANVLLMQSCCCRLCLSVQGLSLAESCVVCTRCCSCEVCASRCSSGLFHYLYQARVLSLSSGAYTRH